MSKLRLLRTVTDTAGANRARVVGRNFGCFGKARKGKSDTLPPQKRSARTACGRINTGSRVCACANPAAFTKNCLQFLAVAQKTTIETPKIGLKSNEPQKPRETKKNCARKWARVQQKNEGKLWVRG